MRLHEILNHQDFINLAHKHISNLKKVSAEHNWGRTLRGTLDLRNNELKNLQGLPVNITGSLNVSHNNLVSLRDVSESIGKNFLCSHNEIETIEHFPKYIGFDADVSFNNIKSLSGIDDQLQTLKGKLMLTGNPIQEKISGLLNVKGLEEVVYSGPNKRAVLAFNELNKRLPLNEGKVPEFAETMHKLGLDEFI